ncbi:RNA polymerase sigma-70 factor [Pedobacter sp. ISL-68]|nr:RNA polymerase sigma-70 factor [Pedobacter sp. ISL-64]MBT2561713.1 RNA polymerase sigma-70 factor [Pedobacter sp. ISL-64]MBT2591101.1 RNA polymerase sigma-70 factor [Pedobacter sp. ISL-68]
MPAYADYSDEELAILLQQGDEQAFAEIYDRFKGLLFVHAYKRLNNQEEAEDVLHDLFAVLWNRRTELSIETSLSAYLYTAVRNRIFKLISHKKITAAYVSLSQTAKEKGYTVTDHLVRTNQLAVLIEAEINALPPKMREVFILSRQKNLNHKEISEKLGLSEQTVSKQITNALKILRMRLGFIAYLYFLIKF